MTTTPPYVADRETLARALATAWSDPSLPPDDAWATWGPQALRQADRLIASGVVQTPADFVAGLADDEALVRHVALLASGLPQTPRDLDRASLHIRALAAALGGAE